MRLIGQNKREKAIIVSINSALYTFLHNFSREKMMYKRTLSMMNLSPKNLGLFMRGERRDYCNKSKTQKPWLCNRESAHRKRWVRRIPTTIIKLTLENPHLNFSFRY